jgi:hypothetical protein
MRTTSARRIMTTQTLTTPVEKFTIAITSSSKVRGALTMEWAVSVDRAHRRTVRRGDRRALPKVGPDGKNASMTI